MLTSLSAHSTCPFSVNNKTSKYTSLVLHSIQNQLLPQGHQKQNFYELCSYSLLTSDSVQSHNYLFGRFKDDLRERFQWKMKPCKCRVPAKAGGEKITGPKYMVFYQNVRKQLVSILTVPKSNYVVFDFTAQVWDFVDL